MKFLLAKYGDVKNIGFLSSYLNEYLDKYFVKYPDLQDKRKFVINYFQHSMMPTLYLIAKNEENKEKYAQIVSNKEMPFGLSYEEAISSHDLIINLLTDSKIRIFNEKIRKIFPEKYIEVISFLAEDAYDKEFLTSLIGNFYTELKMIAELPYTINSRFSSTKDILNLLFSGLGAYFIYLDNCTIFDDLCYIKTFLDIGFDVNGFEYEYGCEKIINSWNEWRVFSLRIDEKLIAVSVEPYDRSFEEFLKNSKRYAIYQSVCKNKNNFNSDDVFNQSFEESEVKDQSLEFKNPNSLQEELDQFFKKIEANKLELLKVGEESPESCRFIGCSILNLRYGYISRYKPPYEITFSYVIVSNYVEYRVSFKDFNKKINKYFDEIGLEKVIFANLKQLYTKHTKLLKSMLPHSTAYTLDEYEAFFQTDLVKSIMMISSEMSDSEIDEIVEDVRKILLKYEGAIRDAISVLFDNVVKNNLLSEEYHVASKLFFMVKCCVLNILINVPRVDKGIYPSTREENNKITKIAKKIFAAHYPNINWEDCIFHASNSIANWIDSHPNKIKRKNIKDNQLLDRIKTIENTFLKYRPVVLKQVQPQIQQQFLTIPIQQQQQQQAGQLMQFQKQTDQVDEQEEEKTVIYNKFQFK